MVRNGTRKKSAVGDKKYKEMLKISVYIRSLLW